MAALKAHTAEAHAAAERRIDFERLTESREGYRRTLEAFYGFYEPIEREFAARADGGFDFVPDARAPRLAADLKALGGSDVGGLPRCGDLPEVALPSQYVGALYVLEGASLGGRVISRQVRERLGIEADAGGSFFHGAGERTGARWREFGRAAETAVAGDDILIAVAAARGTFAALDAWLARCDRRPFDKEVR